MQAVLVGKKRARCIYPFYNRRLALLKLYGRIGDERAMCVHDGFACTVCVCVRLKDAVA